MEQIIIQILNGNLNVEMLLVLFIIGILTKRFVPWWVHEETLAELKKYEEDAPQLMEAVSELTEEIRNQGVRSPKLDEVERQQQVIRRRYRDGPNTRTRRDRHA